VKLPTAIALLRMLKSVPEAALSVEEIAARWPDRHLHTQAGLRRNIQRYMAELSADDADGADLVNKIRENGTDRYYLKLSRVANWFMTEEIALQLLATRQTLERSFGNFARKGKLGAAQIREIAEAVAQSNPETKRIRERIRIVPDGIGRLPAVSNEKVFNACIQAVSMARKLEFSYTDSKGKKGKHVVNPQGLVGKDGSIYLVATTGLSDKPHHYALHRMASAELGTRSASHRNDFDLDKYIESEHGFSHVLRGAETPVALRLRVGPGTLFHFRERRLWHDQVIRDKPGKDGWHIVTATVPNTVLLVPFLMSLQDVEALEPESVRETAAQWAKSAAALYS